MLSFMWGALSMGCVTAALFFFRFFRDTRERLFAAFGGAFVLLGINWAVLAAVRPDDESRHLVYFVRLAAFMLILVGMVDKSRRRA